MTYILIILSALVGIITGIVLTAIAAIYLCK